MITYKAYQRYQTGQYEGAIFKNSNPGPKDVYVWACSGKTATEVQQKLARQLAILRRSAEEETHPWKELDL